MEKDDPTEESHLDNMPKLYSFVLTTEQATRVYCTVLTIKEHPLDPGLEESLSGFNIEDNKAILVPKALILVSHYSYVHNYGEFLKSYVFASTPLPIERYIANFVDEIP